MVDYARIASSAHFRDPKTPKSNPSKKTTQGLKDYKPGLQTAKDNNFRGIVNLGATCYLSASVQLLVACTSFRDAVMQTPLPFTVNIGDAQGDEQDALENAFRVVSDLGESLQDLQDTTIAMAYILSACKNLLVKSNLRLVCGPKTDSKMLRKLCWR